MSAGYSGTLTNGMSGNSFTGSSTGVIISNATDTQPPKSIIKRCVICGKPSLLHVYYNFNGYCVHDGRCLEKFLKLHPEWFTVEEQPKADPFQFR